MYEFKQVALNNTLEWVLEMLIVEGRFRFEHLKNFDEVL